MTDTKTRFCTHKWGTIGITERLGIICDDGVFQPLGAKGMRIDPKDHFVTMEEAEARVRELAEKKLESLERQMIKINKIRVPLLARKFAKRKG